jgi:transcriptional regulator with XRE-family HTH domain
MSSAEYKKKLICFFKAGMQLICFYKVIIQHIWRQAFEMSKLRNQLKNRRKELKLTQDEMMLRVGMSRQQYQRLESRGNPTLENLELIAKGLKLELMLIPLEKLQGVRAVLEGKQLHDERTTQNDSSDENPLANDPWKNLLANDS